MKFHVFFFGFITIETPQTIYQQCKFIDYDVVLMMVPMIIISLFLVLLFPKNPQQQQFGICVK